MKTVRKITLFALFAVLTVMMIFLVTACNDNEEENPPTPPPTEEITLTEADNKYASKEGTEFAGINWSEQINEVGIYYDFDGIYNAGGGGFNDDGYFDLYCLKDGGVYAAMIGSAQSPTMGNNPHIYYGYWYNVDETGEACLVIKFKAFNSTAYDETAYTMKYSGVESGYEFETSANLPVFRGNTARLVVFNGSHYTDISGITVNASSAKTAYNVGEEFNSDGLVISGTASDGSSKSVRFSRCSFSGFNSDAEVTAQEITVNYLGKTAKYNVAVAAKTYTGTASIGGQEKTISIKRDKKAAAIVTLDGKTARCGFEIISGVIFLGTYSEDGSTMTSADFDTVPKVYSIDEKNSAVKSLVEYAGSGTLMTLTFNGMGGPVTDWSFYLLDGDTLLAMFESPIVMAPGTITITYTYLLEGNDLTIKSYISSDFMLFAYQMADAFAIVAKDYVINQTNATAAVVA